MGRPGAASGVESASDSYPTPWRLLLVTAASLFIVEFTIMVTIELSHPATSWMPIALFDAALETVLFFLILFFFLYRPMSGHIKERRRAEEKLRESHDLLEKRVGERTADLRGANEKLRLLSSHILAVQEEERKRLAMELHDEVGQDLASLKLQLRSISDAARANSAEAERECRSALELTGAIIQNVQGLSRDLAPSILVDLGLTEALRWLAAESSKKHGFAVVGDIENINRFFSEETQINIYRIFQEVYANAGKHSGAHEVRFSARQEGVNFLFRIEDDGSGFDPAEAAQKFPTDRGMGLVFLEERARMMGGSLRVNSAPGRGTEIFLKVPCNGEEGV